MSFYDMDSDRDGYRRLRDEADGSDGYVSPHRRLSIDHAEESLERAHHTISEVSRKMHEIGHSLHDLDFDDGSFIRGAGRHSHIGSAGGNVQVGGPVASNQIVAGVQKFLGVPYLWGGTTPKGFDCSGLAQYVYNQAGIKLPRTSEEMWTVGQQVSEAQAQPGDLVFFEGNPPGHVGIYIGNGQMIDAPHTGAVVRQEPIWTNKLTGFRHIPGISLGAPAAPANAPASTPAGASMQGFATALLQELKAPVTQNNINNLMDWMQSESGGLGHRNNPLNSSYLTGGPGDGTGSYPDLTAAAHADALQIMPQSAGGVDTGGKYDGIYQSLMNDAPWHMFKDSVVTSPWASSHYNGGQTFSHNF